MVPLARSPFIYATFSLVTLGVRLTASFNLACLSDSLASMLSSMVSSTGSTGVLEVSVSTTVSSVLLADAGDWLSISVSLVSTFVSSTSCWLVGSLYVTGAVSAILFPTAAIRSSMLAISDFIPANSSVGAFPCCSPRSVKRLYVADLNS